jgi:hypothetical protein
LAISFRIDFTRSSDTKVPGVVDVAVAKLELTKSGRKVRRVVDGSNRVFARLRIIFGLPLDRWVNPVESSEGS